MPSRLDRNGFSPKENPSVWISLGEGIVGTDDSPFSRSDAHVSEQLCAGRLVDQNAAVLRVLLPFDDVPSVISLDQSRLRSAPHSPDQALAARGPEPART